MQAVAEGYCHIGEPIRLLLESILRRIVCHVVLSDSDTARQAVLKGFSRKLAYMKKMTKISIGWIHDTFMHPDNRLDRVDTKRNCSDICTKGLDHEAHWFHCWKLGMMGYSAGTPA